MESPRHEVVIDTGITAAHDVYAKAMSRERSIRKSIDWAVKNKRTHDVEAFTEQLTKARIVTADAREDYHAASAHYEGWSRFFLVTNSNGHIHRTMDCSTCFADTEFAWLPELSGLTEADAVAEYGEILCSVCFKSAPVEWTTGTNKKVAAERELHKALVAIERSPEGKKVKSLKASLSSKHYALNNEERKISRVKDDEAVGYDTPDHLRKAAAEAPAKITKIRKQIAAYEAKLAAAEKALEEALKS